MLILSFDSPQKWREWLLMHHTESKGIWLKIYKKKSGKKSISYDEALDEALCFGWIDGQKNKFDEESWIQKFTQRRPKSIWSKRNKEHITRLLQEKRMTEAGLKEVEAAKADGRWEQAYDSPKNMEPPIDFLEELAKNEMALTFFQGLNKANRYAILWRLQTAKKQETRQKRMQSILEMLSQGQKFY